VQQALLTNPKGCWQFVSSDKTVATQHLTTVCKTYSAFYKFDYMLETPKALSTHHYINIVVKILKIIQWTISRKPTDL